jgi:polyphosphate kinase
MDQPDPNVPSAPTDSAAAAQAAFFNREISWLDFNNRVLELAADASLPLLERVRFLGIFGSNLDEFFMKRVGGLHRQLTAGVTNLSDDGLNVQQQLREIRSHVLPMLQTQHKLWLDELLPKLGQRGLRILKYDALEEIDRSAVDAYFARNVFPILTPLSVDPGHPFPFLSNLSVSVGVMLEQTNRGRKTFVRIKLPETLPRWLPVHTPGVFVPLEQVVGGNLSLLFPGMTILEHQVFRVTRNADLELDEEDADDLLQMVEQELRQRRLAQVVRLELPDSMSVAMRRFITEGVEVEESDIYVVSGPVDSGSLQNLANLDFPAEKFKPWSPIVPGPLANDETNIFASIRQGDWMVHLPYESFAASVEKFIHAAVLDPKVLAIKLSLYRTSPDSPFVLALIHAAEAGKQVAVLVEVKARFDEQRNVKLAQTLESAGVHVVYGMVGLKTHAKVAMVVRDEPDGLRTYCHIGTGNYNSKTAQLYTDLGLFTCNADLADDVVELFHYLTGSSLKRDYRKLLVAPVNMRERFVNKIRREAGHAKAGRPARIIAKMNALQDPKITLELYEASKAGVSIDLIVRGFCTLRPGVPGMSDNIRVISILGRFLEHSRIYHFLNGGDEEFYIGSADWMVRNLDYRVEAVTPVEAPDLRVRLKDILDTCLADYGHAWELHPDGKWTRRVPPTTPGARIVNDSQALNMSKALKAANSFGLGA